ncbi:hypothetical protein K440DRAFT_622590 [Wilcoxina mikolae CBS 423.85]|nr:hypothetical protein K440DRAFT_622590 [Wilcoxina mikolae CBS 423.85]
MQRSVESYVEVRRMETPPHCNLSSKPVNHPAVQPLTPRTRPPTPRTRPPTTLTSRPWWHPS